VRDGKTFRWEGVYSKDMNTRETLRTELNVFEEFRPRLHDRLRSFTDVFLANIDPVLQREVLDQLKHPRLVLCDTMNYWIHGKRKELLEILKRVRILLINEEEARELTGESLMHKAARAILTLGPEIAVIKQGEHGAFLQSRDLYFTCPAVPIESVIDPTGAGDTFAGGFMGYLAQQGLTDRASVRRAMVFGAVMASFAVEDFSLERLKRLARREIEQRYAAFQGMVSVEQ